MPSCSADPQTQRAGSYSLASSRELVLLHPVTRAARQKTQIERSGEGEAYKGLHPLHLRCLGLGLQLPRYSIATFGINIFKLKND